MKSCAPTPEIEGLIQAYVEASLEPAKASTLLEAVKNEPALANLLIEHLESEALIREAVSQADWINLPESTAPRRIQFPRSAVLALAAAFTLVATLCIWYLTARIGSPVVARVTGSATIERAGEFLPVQKGSVLVPGDILHTPGTGALTVAFPPESTTIDLSPSTDFRLLSFSTGKQFFLLAGEMEAAVARQQPFHPMSIHTPMAEARVLGTKLRLATTTHQTRLDVTEGNVRFTRKDGARVDVAAGRFSIAANGRELSALPFTGKVYREYWTNMPGATWIHILADKQRYPDHPSGRNELNRLQISNAGQNYGARIRGYINPPENGDYTFWIAANADGSFWLSADSSPEAKVHTAHSRGDQTFNWSGLDGQKSASPVELIAGRRYYFEILHKQALGSDNLAVAWQIPGHEPEVIEGKYLSPFPSLKGGGK